MPKKPLRPITCMTVGCGYTYKHKRIDGKGWQRERMLHVASGECAKRVNETATADAESRQGGGVTRREVLDLIDPLYDLMRVAAMELEELKHRVEKRLESRKKRKFYIGTASRSRGRWRGASSS